MWLKRKWIAIFKSYKWLSKVKTSSYLIRTSSWTLLKMGGSLFDLFLCSPSVSLNLFIIVDSWSRWKSWWTGPGWSFCNLFESIFLTFHVVKVPCRVYLHKASFPWSDGTLWCQRQRSRLGSCICSCWALQEPCSREFLHRGESAGFSWGLHLFQSLLFWHTCPYQT